MALIARIQHPYIVEFKEAWVEKVMRLGFFFFNNCGNLRIADMFIELG
jgi:hypothetical protein